MANGLRALQYRRKAGERLKQNANEIAILWLQNVMNELPIARQQEPRALRDMVPFFLTDLAEELSQGQAVHECKAIRLAEEHGKQRAEMEGYRIEEVLLEYHVLRRTIFEILNREVPLDPSESGVINDAIDRGVAEAGQAFMKGRNASELLRREQTEAALAALQKSEERFRLLTEASPFVIYTNDAEGICDYVNPRWTKFTGLTLEQSVGFGWASSVHPDDLPGLMELWRSRKDERDEAESQFRLRRKDGVYHWFMTKIVPLTGPEKVLGWCGISVDIHDQKRAVENERFLARAGMVLSSSLDMNTTLRKLAELTVPAMADWCVIDMFFDGKLDRVAVAHANPSLKELAESLEGTVCDMDAPYGAPAAYRKNHSILSNGSEVAPWLERKDPAQLELMRRMGYRSYMTVLMKARGRTIGAISLVAGESGRIYDAADLEFAEALAQRAAFAVDNSCLYRDIQSAVRVREDVIAIVTHDLKTPLSTILLNSSMLLRSLLGERAGGVLLQSADRIKKAALRMQGLIQNILDLAKIEGGAFSVEARTEQVETLVREAVELMRPTAGEQGVELVFRILADVKECYCDRMRVLQVFSNLLGNAIKFSPKGGTIEITAEPRGKEVLVSILDEGSGVPPENREHLFERYWQAREQRIRGTGLGLYIAKGIIDAHSGRIWYEPNEPRGSAFRFTLPIHFPGA